MQISFDEALAVLVDREHKDFYATMATCLPRRESKNVATMGLTVTDGSYELLYNSEGIKALTPKEFIYLLHHEMVHLENKHLPRSMVQVLPLGGAETDITKEAWDFCQKATDFAVNGEMRSLNRGADYVQHMLNESQFNPLFPEQFGINNMPEGDFEAYYQILHLMKPPESENGDGDDDDGDDADGGEGGEPGDPNDLWGENHTGWGQTNSRNKEGDVEEGTGPSTPDEMLEMAKTLENESDQIIRSAAEAVEKSRGTVPGHILDRLAKLAHQYAIPWQLILANVIRTKIAETKRRSVQRPKRRVVDPSFFLPGKVSDKTFKAVICIDTSGSMRNDEIRECFSVAQELLNQEEGMVLIGIQADTRVSKEWTIEPHEEWVDIYGRGGTNFDPALQRCQELEPDLVLYYTDGYAPCPSTKSLPNCPLIWLISRHGSNPYGLDAVGKVVVLKDQV